MAREIKNLAQETERKRVEVIGDIKVVLEDKETDLDKRRPVEIIFDAEIDGKIRRIQYKNTGDGFLRFIKDIDNYHEDWKPSKDIRALLKIIMKEAVENEREKIVQAAYKFRNPQEKKGRDYGI